MSDLDNQIIDFKDSMSKAALYAKGSDTTDVVTPNGSVPSIAKQARINAAIIAGLVPDLNNRLRLDSAVTYSNNQKAFARANIGLDLANNTADADKPVSTLVQQAIDALVQSIALKEVLTHKNQAGGYAGLTGMKLTLPNNAQTFTGLLDNNISADRAWSMPNKDGVVALLSDITGTNTNNNTGDETTATIKAKLSISTLSGANTGDETSGSILSKLGISSLSGTNTGDETRSRVVALIGYESLPQGAVGSINGVAPLGSNRLIPTQFLPSAFESIVLADNIGALPVTGVEKRIYITQEEAGMFYWNQVDYVDLKASINNSDQLTEGTTNKYFNNARVLAAVLTTYVAGANTGVAATDTVVAAVGKLQGQISAAVTDYTTKLSTKEVLVNKATNFSVLNDTLYPSVLAAKTYIDSRLVGVLNDRGSFDASGGGYPTTGGSDPTGSIRKGDFWYISVAGTMGSQVVNVGDSVRALADAPAQVAAKWDALESNIGYVPYNATNPANYTSNQTDAYLLSRANHTGTQPASTIVESPTQVFVTAGEKTLIQHANRTAVDAVLGVNTGDETQTTILNKIGVAPVTINVNGTVRFQDAANAAGSFNVPFGDALNSNTFLKTDSELLYSPSANTLSAFFYAGKSITLFGDSVVAQTVAGTSKIGGSTTAGAEIIGIGTVADVTLYDRNKVARLSVTPSGITVAGPVDGARGADIASAGTINLTTATGKLVDVTGTVPINTITLLDGAVRFVRFTGVTTLTNGASLVLPTGQNIITAPGDYAIFAGRTSNTTHCIFYQRATGSPLVGGLQDKARSVNATTAATAIDLNTGDQATAFRVTIAANTTVTFSNPPAAPNGEIFSFTMITINDATAGRGMAFGNTIKWAGGILPPRTTTANAIDVWTFYVDGGVYYGSLAIIDAK